MDLSKILNFLTPQGLKEIIKNLRNQNEDLFQENLELKKRAQELEDQLRLAKGEKPIPKFTKPKDVTAPRPTDESEKKDRKERRKTEDLKIDETKRLMVERGQLPPGAIHKGYRRVTIQEILFERHNICFELERFLDPATGKIIEAKLPAEFQGHEFGPVLRSFIVSLYFDCDSTHGKIKRQLAGIDINISTSHINNVLLKSADAFDGELTLLREKSLQIDGVQHIDDTSWKVLREQTAFTIVTGNKFFTRFTTVQGKSRHWAIFALSGGVTAKYKMNDVAVDYAVAASNSLKLRAVLKDYCSGRLYNNSEVNELLAQEGLIDLSASIKWNIRTGMYVAALRSGELGECGNALMSDDAGQFNNLYADHGLCWVHELRHYKLIEALNEENRLKLEIFLSDAWSLYETIKLLRAKLSPERLNYVLKEFDRIFVTGATGFKKLDQQRKLSAAKIDKLLAPLFNAGMPMHNNAAELDVRGRVIKRRVSYFNGSWRGARAWDTYLGLKESCRKLGVSFYQKVLARFECRRGPQLYEMLTAT